MQAYFKRPKLPDVTFIWAGTFKTVALLLRDRSQLRESDAMESD